jgi:hypothetical protein
VLIGGPRCGQEVDLGAIPPWRLPRVHVPCWRRPAWLEPGRAVSPDEAVSYPVGVYEAPLVHGHWSRDDAGRLRLEWRGER